MKLNRQMQANTRIYPEKVLQFGEGVFLRGFADWQIHQMNKHTTFKGSIVAVNPRITGNAGKLNEQDGLFTVSLQGIQDGKAVKEHEVIESISRGLNPYEDYEAYMQLAEKEELRFLISNTTEAGIAFLEEDRLEHAPQKSFPGKVTAFLYKRFKAFQGDPTKGLIILPCELVERNGDLLKKMVLRYADKWNLEKKFTEWIHEANAFCCTLVDRIVSGYPNDKNTLAEVSYEDDFFVIAEPFYLWVIEGPEWVKAEFPAEEAGLHVKFVNDIAPYALQKVRILNGIHTAMMPVAYLAELNTVREAVEDEVIGTFIRKCLYEEIIPCLPVSEEESLPFAKSALERFQNPFIHHALMSISLNSMTKFKTRNIPTLKEYVQKQGTLPVLLTFSLSALISFYKGKREGGKIELSDDPAVLEMYESLWNTYDGTEKSISYIVKEVLGYKEHWGEDLNIIPSLTEVVTTGVLAIETFGMKQAMKEILYVTATKQ
ncbi:tagaturonate reductase [Priestia megaterium]|uniref:tagaturonate reductase n=1 Tax=Priestia megaterium TaxID=1404 RepID=UPI00234EA9FF|nr:tagaturonate reductase [Priestia megaterium]MDC7722460.1 tagaturonate reductase [Priestia megaterium]